VTLQTLLTPTLFAARFQECWRVLWCVAAAVTGDRGQADDILQESAMVALNKLEQFDPATNFIAWMSQIVRFVALNHARKKSRSPASSLDPHAMELTMSSAKPVRQIALGAKGELHESDELSASFDDRLLGALRSLEETARACLLLRTLMDMSYREISLALDIPEGTAMSHVHRSRTWLRQRLTDPSLSESSSQPAISAIKSERNGHIHG
jgi:RNA polymerase sigma-70 factor (ECF subfamily)